MSLFNEINWRDVGERMLATAVETFLGVLVGLEMFDVDATVLQVAGASALSAALVVPRVALRNWLAKRAPTVG